MSYRVSNYLAWLVGMAGVHALAHYGAAFGHYTRFQRFLYVTLVMCMIVLIDIEHEVTER